MLSQFTVNCLFTDHEQLNMSITNHKELKMPITCHENKYIYPTWILPTHPRRGSECHAGKCCNITYICNQVYALYSQSRCLLRVSIFENIHTNFNYFINIMSTNNPEHIQQLGSFIHRAMKVHT